MSKVGYIAFITGILAMIGYSIFIVFLLLYSSESFILDLLKTATPKNLRLILNLSSTVITYLVT